MNSGGKSNSTRPRPYRSRQIADTVIAFSISYQPDNLLARGMGFDHLRELLLRLATFLLRQGANLAYGGNWKETEDNFTFELLRLVSAEQEDSSLGRPDPNQQIGRLFNYSAWPYSLEITPGIEAQWINCCSIVRITQQDAGFSGADVVSDADASAKAKEPRTLFNTAVTLSAMRRMMMDGLSVAVPGFSRGERIPPVIARILLGGSVDRYSGFIPGIFEEALVTLEKRRPVYILGGFGGAAEILANAILASASDRPDQLTLAWQREQNPDLASLLDKTGGFSPPGEFRSANDLLDALFAFVQKARSDPSRTLNTGLSDDDTRELLMTRNIATAVRLVCAGLAKKKGLPSLSA
jgi:hypothetical protein